MSLIVRNVLDILDTFYCQNGFVPFDQRVSEEDGVTYDLMFTFLK